MCRAVGLYGLALLDVSVTPKVGEDLLYDLGLLWCRSTTEDVELDSEPGKVIVCWHLSLFWVYIVCVSHQSYISL